MLQLVVVACAEKDDFNKNIQLDDSVITFVSSVEQTKGTPITDGDDVPSLGVLAFIDDETYINNREATKGSDGWSLLNPVVYWPSDSEKKITFFTYSPYDEARYEYGEPYGSVNNNQGISEVSATSTEFTLKYSAPTDCTNQPDLMVAYNADASKADGAVTLEHKHALAAIGFSYSNFNYSGVEYVKFKNVVTDGTLTYSPTKNGDEQLSWSLESPSDIVLEPNMLDISNNITSSETSPSIITEDGYLMMIPQNLDGVIMTVGLIHYTGDTEEKEFLFTSSDSWVAGKQYTYEIYLDQIELRNYYTYNATALLYSSNDTEGDNLDTDLDNKNYIGHYSWEFNELYDGSENSSGDTPFIDNTEYIAFTILPAITDLNSDDLEMEILTTSENKEPEIKLTLKNSDIDYNILASDTYKRYYVNDKITSAIITNKLMMTYLSFRIKDSSQQVSKVVLKDAVVEATYNLRTEEWSWDKNSQSYKGDITLNIETTLPNGYLCGEKTCQYTVIPQNFSDITSLQFYDKSGNLIKNISSLPSVDWKVGILNNIDISL
ncbi:MAG: fimbrillin family protein [Rikenellaceae bacterium]